MSIFRKRNPRAKVVMQTPDGNTVTLRPGEDLYMTAVIDTFISPDSSLVKVSGNITTTVKVKLLEVWA